MRQHCLRRSEEELEKVCLVKNPAQKVGTTFRKVLPLLEILQIMASGDSGKPSTSSSRSKCTKSRDLTAIETV